MQELGLLQELLAVLREKLSVSVDKLADIVIF